MLPTLFLIVSLLMVGIGAVQVTAQEGFTCQPEDINSQMDDLLATYTDSREQDALGAAETLQMGIEAIMTGCTNADDVVDSGEVDTQLDGAASLTPGQWQIIWGVGDEVVCPDGQTIDPGARDRLFLLTVDPENDQITALDGLNWPLVFTRSAEGEYSFTRNESYPDGSASTFEYRINIVEPGLIEGTITAYLFADCVVESPFEMVLVDGDIMCMVNSQTGANLRSGPGTSFSRAGVLPTFDLQPVTGQASDSDGFTWWQLAAETWVRSDVVDETGDCDSVPVVSAE